MLLLMLLLQRHSPHTAGMDMEKVGRRRATLREAAIKVEVGTGRPLCEVRKALGEAGAEVEVGAAEITKSRPSEALLHRLLRPAIALAAVIAASPMGAVAMPPTSDSTSNVFRRECHLHWTAKNEVSVGSTDLAHEKPDQALLLSC